MLFEFFFWWYVKGWVEAWKTALSWVTKVQREFSALVLLQTLFSPWKQIITLPGKSLDEKFKAMIDNLVSRVIGFVVRFLVLLVAGILMVFAGAAGLVLAVSWPFIPLAIVFCLIRSITG